jgi:hypothetical protein
VKKTRNWTTELHKSACEDDSLNGFVILLHAYDHVWRSKKTTLRGKAQACDIIWRLALKVAWSSASTAGASTFLSKLDALSARVKR